MKKVLVSIVTVLLLFTINSFAAKNNSSFFAKLGVNISKFSPIPESEYSKYVKSGNFLNFGGGVEIEISKNLIYQTGLFYSVKGMAWDGKFTDDEDNVTIEWNGSDKISYLEIPMLAKYLVNSSKGMKISVLAGPYISKKVSAKEESKAIGYNEEGTKKGEEKEEYDLDEDIAGTDFGIILGAEVNYMISGYNLMFGAQYEIGLKNIYVDEDRDQDVHNRAFFVFIGLNF